MTRATSTFTIAIIALIIIVLTSSSVKNVSAISVDDSDFTIERVNHTIKILYNGYIILNDTIRVVGNATFGQYIDSFLVGVPYIYGQNLIRCVAYDASSVFNVTLNVPLDNHIGFYAVEINFPQPLDISIGREHAFTVQFLFSNNLLQMETVGNETFYTINFPAFPSLVKKATVCDALIVLPAGASYVGGTVNASTYSQRNLPELTSSPADLTFSLTEEKIQLIDVKELQREVGISETGELKGSDSYYVTSKSTEDISSIEIVLPPNASNPTVQDQFGRRMSQPTLLDAKTNRYKISFSSLLESYRSTRFKAEYDLPSIYLTQIGANSFNVTFPLFQNVNYYIESASVDFLLPEGARISSFESTLVGSEYAVTRSVFQEEVTINRRDISLLDNVLRSENVLQIVYEYNPLWVSFRPTLWMWALAIVGCTVVFVWKRPKAPVPVITPAVAMRLRPESIKSFVDAYEEKRKITLEIESLESKVRKGKIPRRRYKVQRKTLETRLSSLSRNLADFKERMRSVGGQYVELMRQLEIAETEINEVEANIKSIEARHSRGELSLEAYRKLLADYERRKEKADTTINGILLRLREEIR